MILYMPPTTYIAQVYSCDAYGASDYSNCPTTSSSSSSSGSGTSSGSTSHSTNGSSTTNNSSTSSNDATSSNDTSNNSSNSNTPDNGGYQTTNNNPSDNTPVNAVAGLGWEWILLIAVGIAVVIAWVILLVRRRGRNNSQVPPTYLGPSA